MKFLAEQCTVLKRETKTVWPGSDARLKQEEVALEVKLISSGDTREFTNSELEYAVAVALAEVRKEKILKKV